MNLENVIIAPIITEKSNYNKEIGQRIKKRITKYTFKVHPDANKQLVAKAVEHIFKVKPDYVNVMVYRGKVKRFRNIPVRKSHWKKAIVTFLNGAELELSKGV